jgi:hypothetical protein
MSDGFSLLLVLVLVYLSDCIIFLRRHSVALVRPWAWWSTRLPNLQLGNAKGALLWVQPLPPLGVLHETAVWPFSISEDGICAFTGASFTGPDRPPQSGAAFLHADIREVKPVGNAILVNGTPFVSTLTASLATEIASLISAVAVAPRERRTQLIADAVDASLDVKAARDESAAAVSRTRGLLIACNVLWVYLYVACPALTSLFGLTWLILPLVFAGLLIHIPIVVWFARLHGRACPSERSQRIEQVFRMCLCPPMAIRAVDAVTRHALWRHHPAAAAVALCRRPEAESLAGLTARDLRYPASMPLEGDAARIESSFRSILARRLEAMAAAEGIALRRHPDDSHVAADSRAFCPRCLNVFSVETGVCQDCQNVKLEPLPARHAGGKADK